MPLSDGKGDAACLPFCEYLGEGEDIEAVWCPGWASCYRGKTAMQNVSNSGLWNAPLKREARRQVARTARHQAKMMQIRISATLRMIATAQETPQLVELPPCSLLGLVLLLKYALLLSIIFNKRCCFAPAHDYPTCLKQAEVRPSRPELGRKSVVRASLGQVIKMPAIA